MTRVRWESAVVEINQNELTQGSQLGVSVASFGQLESEGRTRVNIVGKVLLIIRNQNM